MLIVSFIILAVIAFFLGMYYVERRNDPERLLSEAEKEHIRKKLRKDNYNLDTEKRSCRECDGDPNLVRNNWCAKCEKLEGGEE